MSVISSDDTIPSSLGRILAEIPLETWDRIIQNEPEWQEMNRFLPVYGFGPFTVLMTACGLNDYQLKGRAEYAYWPHIRYLITDSPVPKNPVILGAILAEFYKNERLADDKLRRLTRFTKSHLASDIWLASPEYVSRSFLDIYRQLAVVMRQSPEKKTIVFAMKCIALALLMAGNRTFPFEKIPIPVDLRIVRMTKCLRGTFMSEDLVRIYWDKVLNEIRQRHPEISMVHLDSLLWQVAGLSNSGIYQYFASLNISKIGDKFAHLLEVA